MNPGVPCQYLSSLFNLSDESAREHRPHFLHALSGLVILLSLVQTIPLVYVRIVIWRKYPAQKKKKKSHEHHVPTRATPKSYVPNNSTLCT